jgi:hypothetical protein
LFTSEESFYELLPIINSNRSVHKALVELWLDTLVEYTPVLFENPVATAIYEINSVYAAPRRDVEEIAEFEGIEYLIENYANIYLNK